MKKQTTSLQIIKVEKSFAKIAKALATDKWEQITVSGWVKKDKGDVLTDNLMLYINGNMTLKKKKWWRFWI